MNHAPSVTLSELCSLRFTVFPAEHQSYQSRRAVHMDTAREGRVLTRQSVMLWMIKLVVVEEIDVVGVNDAGVAS